MDVTDAMKLTLFICMCVCLCVHVCACCVCAFISVCISVMSRSEFLRSFNWVKWNPENTHRATRLNKYNNSIYFSITFMCRLPSTLIKLLYMLVLSRCKYNQIRSITRPNIPPDKPNEAFDIEHHAFIFSNFCLKQISKLLVRNDVQSNMWLTNWNQLTHFKGAERMRMNMARILVFDIDISHTYFNWRHQTYWLPRIPKCYWSGKVIAGRCTPYLAKTPNNPRLLIAYLWIKHIMNLNVLSLNPQEDYTHSWTHANTNLDSSSKILNTFLSAQGGHGNFWWRHSWDK